MKLPKDANNVPMFNPNVGIVTTKTMTFDGATENDPGDYDGTGNPATLFTVSGIVLAKVFALCSEDLAGATATLEVGVAGATAALIAQTTATAIDDGDLWHDDAPDASIEAYSVATEYLLTDDVIQTVGTANITDGTITYVCLWYPVTDGATVT